MSTQSGEGTNVVFGMAAGLLDYDDATFDDVAPDVLAAFNGSGSSPASDHASSRRK